MAIWLSATEASHSMRSVVAERVVEGMGDESPLAAVDHALEVLLSLSKVRPDGLSLRDIASKMGVAKSRLDAMSVTAPIARFSIGAIPERLARLARILQRSVPTPCTRRTR